MDTPRNTNPVDQIGEISVSIVPVPSGYRDNERYRQREAGTGYGRSSGYARSRRYANGKVKGLFRCG